MKDRRRSWRWVILATAVSLSASLESGTANPAVDWWTIDAGGTLSSAGGNWQLSGTTGQWDATPPSRSAGGSWTLTGGFWALGLGTVEIIFQDGFEEVMGSE